MSPTPSLHRKRLTMLHEFRVGPEVSIGILALTAVALGQSISSRGRENLASQPLPHARQGSPPGPKNSGHLQSSYE